MNKTSLACLFLAAAFAAGCASTHVILNKHSTDLGKIKRIAVIPVDDEAPGGGKVYDRRNVVASDIAEMAFISLGYTVVDRSNLENILKEQSLSNTGLIDPADALKIGQQFGVDALAFINTSEDMQTTRVRLVDTETGRVVLTYQQYPSSVIEGFLGRKMYRDIKKALKQAGVHIDASRVRTFWGGIVGRCCSCVNDPALIKSIEKVAIAPDSKSDLGLDPLLEKGFDVIERSELSKILKQNGLALSGILSGDDMKKLGMISGVRGILYPRMTDYVLSHNIIPIVGTLKLVDAQTGQVIWVACPGSEEYVHIGNIKPEKYIAHANKRFKGYLDKIMKIAK